VREEQDRGADMRSSSEKGEEHMGKVIVSNGN
jgi:hypothetical protein